MGVSNQPVNENIPYQDIPERRQEVQTLISEFQRPPEVTEQKHSQADNSGQIRENRNQDSILNQQWNEPLHLQPPMRSASVCTLQTTSIVTNTLNSHTIAGANVENPATRQALDFHNTSLKAKCLI